MSDMNVSMSSGLIMYSGGIDAEWQAIIRRLLSYGKNSTQNKYRDRELLHSIELEKAKQENSITTKFLTVTKKEQEEIQAKKKGKKAENNPEQYDNSQKGATALGEQLYLAIKMKNKKPAI